MLYDVVVFLEDGDCRRGLLWNWVLGLAVGVWLLFVMCLLFGIIYLI